MTREQLVDAAQMCGRWVIANKKKLVIVAAVITYHFVKGLPVSDAVKHALALVEILMPVVGP